MSRQQIVTGAVAAVVIAGAGFIAGMTVARASEPTAAAARPSAAASGGAGAAQFGGGSGANAGGLRPVAGQIISVNADSITIAMRQPGAGGTTTSLIVLVGPSTRVVKTSETDIKLTDLKAGDTVEVVGTSDSSGALAAQAVITGPSTLTQILGGGAGGGAPRPSGSGATSPRPSPSPTR